MSGIKNFPGTSVSELGPKPASASVSVVGATGGGGLPVSATIVDPIGPHTAATSVSVTIATDEPAIPVDIGAGPFHVIVDSSALPTGAATSGNQTNQISYAITTDTNISAINGKTPALGQAVMASSVPVAIASNQAAIPVTIAAVPLPTGAATAANQVLEITALNSIDGKTVHVDTGAVVVASSALPTGASTSALQTSSNVSLASIDTKTLAAGQAVMASSSPVVIASNQSAIPVTVASVPLPTGAATAANQATEIASLASIDGKLVDGFGTATAGLRTAAQIGNATGAADFNAGAAGAQTLRVVNATGGAPSTVQSGAYVTSTRTDFSSVTLSLSTWTQLVTSTSANINQLTAFMSSGVTLELGTGAAASETRALLVPPGGFDAVIPLFIASGTRISVRAVDAVPAVGFLLINMIT